MNAIELGAIVFGAVGFTLGMTVGFEGWEAKTDLYVFVNALIGSVVMAGFGGLIGYVAGLV